MDFRGDTQVRVVAILPDRRDQASLSNIFAHSNWRLNLCQSVREALTEMRDDRVGVVLCDSSSPDCDWREVLNRSVDSEVAPRLIVAMTSPDSSQWAEVLNLGGYDAILKPFDREEVLRLVSLAWLSWRDSRMWQEHKRGPSRAQADGEPVALVS